MLKYELVRPSVNPNYCAETRKTMTEYYARCDKEVVKCFGFMDMYNIPFPNVSIGSTRYIGHSALKHECDYYIEAGERNNEKVYRFVVKHYLKVIFTNYSTWFKLLDKS